MVLLFNCFIYRQNVTCLKLFIRYIGIAQVRWKTLLVFLVFIFFFLLFLLLFFTGCMYVRKKLYINHRDRPTRSSLLNCCAKNYSVQLWFDDAMLKSSWLFVDTLQNDRAATGSGTRSPASAGIANRPLVFLGIFLIFGSNTPTWSVDGVENQLHY